MTDATGEDITNGTLGEVCGPVTIAGGTCRDLLNATEQALYDRYVTAGQDPTAWCWQYQCRGDVDNATETFFKYRVYNLDIAELVNNWKAKIDTANPCADIDHGSETFFKYRVYNLDIAEMVNNWKAKDVDLADCPTYLAP